MEQAILAVNNGESLRSVAKKFNIPVSTLTRHWNYEVRGFKVGKHGRDRKFSDDEERFIVDLMMKAAAIGIPFDKATLKRIVIRACQEKGLEGKFSDCWLYSFLKRHSEISIRISHASNRKKEREWTVENSEQWMTLLSELHIDGWLDNPEGLYNLDQSAFKLTKNANKVHAKKGTKNADRDNGEHIAVLACGRASGKVLKPLILFDEEPCDTSRLKEVNDSCYLAVNGSGRMNHAVFSTYIKQEIIPSMTADKNLIFVGGHSSHIYDEDSLFVCANTDKHIKIVCFPSGQSKLQPLNSAVFSPIEKRWNEYLNSLGFKTGESVSKEDFSTKLMELWSTPSLGENLKCAFREAGIFPFDPCNVLSTVVSEVTQKKETLPTVEKVYAQQLTTIREAMLQIHPLSSTVVDFHMKKIVDSIKGIPPQFSGMDIPGELQNALKEFRPAKKKKVQLLD